MKLPFTGRAARRAANAAGVAGIAACCAGMVSMLPATVAAALGALGIGDSGVLARTLSPFAQPLFIVSAVFVIVGAFACSRVVVLAASAGSLLLYLSMFQLATGGSSGSGSMSMAAMQHPHSASLRAEPATFYLGLTLLLAAFATSTWRRRRHACQPLLHFPQLSLGRRY